MPFGRDIAVQDLSKTISEIMANHEQLEDEIRWREELKRRQTGLVDARQRLTALLTPTVELPSSMRHAYSSCVRLMLNFCDIVTRKTEKIKLMNCLMEWLTTHSGLVESNVNFGKVVKKKLVEFIQTGDFPMGEKHYEALFGRDEELENALKTAASIEEQLLSTECSSGSEIEVEDNDFRFR